MFKIGSAYKRAATDAQISLVFKLSNESHTVTNNILRMTFSTKQNDSIDADHETCFGERLLYHSLSVELLVVALLVLELLDYLLTTGFGFQHCRQFAS